MVTKFYCQESPFDVLNRVFNDPFNNDNDRSADLYNNLWW